MVIIIANNLKMLLFPVRLNNEARGNLRRGDLILSISLDQGRDRTKAENEDILTN